MSCALAITILLSMLLASGWGQQYQQRQAENYVDGYESAYDARAPNRPLHPTPRSYGSDAPGGSEKQPAEAAPKPTPVAILKQINRHNEDGSYTYGFEGADGSFKIETKLPTGEVKGKYGFVDDTGKVRVVQYGANQYGFQPAGEGITVAPPTLVDETTNREGLSYQDYDYQQQQQQPQQQPARPAPPPPPPAPAHTQAIYAPQQRPANSPIFTPARQQSPLLRASGYDEPAPQRAPPSQAYNQGPVQFGPTPGQADPRQGPPQSRGASGGGILDQLARDYALPQDVAAPLHDISFGYY